MFNAPPFSISEGEFNYFYNFILRNNLKLGFEVATAFGISSLAAGLAFRETGGAMVTIDAYIEEAYGSPDAYLGKQEVHENSAGLYTAKWLHEQYGVDKTVHLQVGWSPDDVSKCIKNAFGNEAIKFDWVFSDGAHTDEAVIADFEAIKHLINMKRFAYFIHDIAGKRKNSRCIKHIRQALNIVPAFTSSNKYSNRVHVPQTWGIAIFTNIPGEGLEAVEK